MSQKMNESITDLKDLYNWIMNQYIKLIATSNLKPKPFSLRGGVRGGSLNPYVFINFGLIRFSSEKISSHFSWVITFFSRTASS